MRAIIAKVSFDDVRVAIRFPTPPKVVLFKVSCGKPFLLSVSPGEGFLIDVSDKLTRFSLES